MRIAIRIATRSAWQLCVCLYALEQWGRVVVMDGQER